MKFFPGCCCDTDCEAYCNNLNLNLDDFSQVSGTWNVTSGRTEISNDNALLVHSSLSTSNNFLLSVRIDVDNNGLHNDINEYRLIFNYLNSNNYWYLTFLPTQSILSAGYLAFFKVVSGTHTQLAIVALDPIFTVGTQAFIQVCYRNGILFGSTNSYAVSYTPTISLAGQFGIGTGSLNGPPATFDNFCAYIDPDENTDSDCVICDDVSCGCGQTLPNTLQVTLCGISSDGCNECTPLNGTHMVTYDSTVVESGDIICRFIKEGISAGDTDGFACSYKIVLDIIFDTSESKITLRVRTYLILFGTQTLDATFSLGIDVESYDCYQLDHELDFINATLTACIFSSATCQVTSPSLTPSSCLMPIFGFGVFAILSMTNSFTANSAFDFNIAADLSSIISISSSPGLDFDFDGTLVTTEDLLANVSLDFDVSSTISASASIESDISLSYELSSETSSIGSMESDADFDFTTTSTLSATSEMSSSIDIDFSPTSEISAIASISSDMDIDFDIEATIHTGADLIADLNLDFDITSTISRISSMVTNINYNFIPVSTIKGNANIESDISLSFETSQTISVSSTKEMSCSISMDFTPSVTISATASVSTNVPFDFDLTATLSQAGDFTCCESVPSFMNVFVDNIGEDSGASCCESINGSWSTIPLTESTSTVARYSKDFENYCSTYTLNIFIELRIDTEESCEVEVIFTVYDGETEITTLSYNDSFSTGTLCSAFPSIPFAGNSGSVTMTCAEGTSEVSMTEEA